MRRADFETLTAGRLIENLDGRLTYVPDPLPVPLVPDYELMALAEAAQNKIGRVDGAAGRLPEPRIVIQPMLRREAQASSRIENVITNYRDLATAPLGGAVDRPEAVAEALRNEAALHLALDAVQGRGRPISNTLLREVQRVLLGPDANPGLSPGAYRPGQAYLAGPGRRIEDAVFVPPPPHEVPGLMDDLMRFIDERRDVPPLVRNAMVHHQFETIHPFADGNGRVGRALILMLLCQDGLLRRPALNPSLYMERSRRDYYGHMQDARTHGGWYAWVRYFIGCLADAADDALATVDGLVALQGQYHAAVRAAGMPAAVVGLVDDLFVRQAVTMQTAAASAAMTRQGVTPHVAKLERMSILDRDHRPPAGPDLRRAGGHRPDPAVTTVASAGRRQETDRHEQWDARRGSVGAVVPPVGDAAVAGHDIGAGDRWAPSGRVHADAGDGGGCDPRPRRGRRGGRRCRLLRRLGGINGAVELVVGQVESSSSFGTAGPPARTVGVMTGLAPFITAAVAGGCGAAAWWLGGRWQTGQTVFIAGALAAAVWVMIPIAW